MPIDVDGGASALAPEEAFALLGHETRVAILQVLWDSFESAGSDNELTYTELFDRVDVQDSGNFSYHLEKLTGPFVRSTDVGYELKQTGINVVRAVVEGTVNDDPAFGPVPLDLACPICDASVEVSYADELLTVSCTACEGRIHGRGSPDTSSAHRCHRRASTDDRSRTSSGSAMVFTMYKLAAFIEGVCSDCSTPVETTVETCHDHDPGAATRCPTCDRSNLVQVWMACPTCKLRVFLPVTLVVFNHPEVVALHHEHGIDHRFADWETVVRSYQVREELLSEEPLMVLLTIPAEDGDLEVTVDEELNVVEIAT